jgi:hypothetical protein
MTKKENKTGRKEKKDEETQITTRIVIKKHLASLFYRTKD